MYCKRCGFKSADTSQFCEKCGNNLRSSLSLSKSDSIEVQSPSPESWSPNVAASPVAPTAVVAPNAVVALDNFLVQSIIVTLCCCLPFGIVSIVYAAKVNDLRAAGNFYGANEAALKARFWFWWALGVGLPVQIILLVINIVMA